MLLFKEGLRRDSLKHFPVRLARDVSMIKETWS